MKVLVDECAPAALKAFLLENGIDCVTVPEAGWSGKTNGELLALAQQHYEVLVTIDRHMRYQQNLTGLRLALVVIRARSNRLVDLRPHFPACLEALRSIKTGQVIEVGAEK